MARRKLPYGYIFKDGEPVIAKEEADVIRWVYQQRIQGRSNYSIGKELYEKGNPYFSDTVGKANCKVAMILYSSFYSDGTYPPIVDHNDYEKVCSLKGENKNWGKAGRTENKKQRQSDKKTEHWMFVESTGIAECEKALKKIINEDNDFRNLKKAVIDLVAARYDCITGKNMFPEKGADDHE